MANEYYPESMNNPFSFLEHENVCSHFADLNIKLLRSKRIQDDDFYCFELLQDYEVELKNYYLHLYGLNLVKEKKDMEVYYYLEFPPESKGKLSDSSRYKELTEKRVLIGLILANIYYASYFTKDKIVNIKEIYQEIQEGEYSNYYKSLLLKEVSDHYSDLDWQKRVEDPFRRTIKEFEKLGWVKIINNANDSNYSFILKASFNRFIKLYEQEIINFEQFAQNYNLEEVE